MSVYIILMLSVSAIKLYLYIHRCNESCVCMSTNCKWTLLHCYTGSWCER